MEEATVEVIIPEKRKRNSVAWKYFDDLGHFQARCKICKRTLCSTSTSNLTKHIERKHPTAKLPDSTIVANYQGYLKSNYVVETDDEAVLRKRTSPAWKYFDDLGDSQARCRICDRRLCYTTISNLTKHVKRKHPSANFEDCTVVANYEEYPKDNFVMETDDEALLRVGSNTIEITNGEITNGNHKTRKTSKAWKYFAIVDDQNKMAKCKLCDALLKYSNISNLTKHVNNKHRDVLDIISSGTDEETVWSESEDLSSKIWEHFKMLDTKLKIASCNICDKRVDYQNDTDMLSHMRKRHPNVLWKEKQDERQFFYHNGAVYEVETTDSTGTIEEVPAPNNLSDDTSDPDVTYISTRTRTPPSKRRKEQLITTPSVDRNVQHDTFHYYGLYVASLLRQLPANVSQQLQFDFIQKLLETKTAIVQDRNVTASDASEKETTEV